MKETIALNYDSKIAGEWRDSRFTYADRVGPNGRAAQTPAKDFRKGEESCMVAAFGFNTPEQFDHPRVVPLDYEDDMTAADLSSMRQAAEIQQWTRPVLLKDSDGAELFGVRLAFPSVPQHDDRSDESVYCRCSRRWDQPAPGCKWHEAEAEKADRESPLNPDPIAQEGLDAIDDDTPPVITEVHQFTWDDVRRGDIIQVTVDDLARIGRADKFFMGVWLTPLNQALGGPNDPVPATVGLVERAERVPDGTVILVDRGTDTEEVLWWRDGNVINLEGHIEYRFMDTQVFETIEVLYRPPSE